MMDEKILYNEDTIFHYTSRKTFLENILPTMKLKLSAYGKTNDPAEYKDLTFVGVGPFSDHPNAKIEKTALRIHLNEQIQENVRIVCFCRNEDVKNEETENSGFAKSRMWSQYGDDHYGVCLAFNRKKLKNSIYKIIDGNDYLLDQKVNYFNGRNIFIESRTINNIKAAEIGHDAYIKYHIIHNFNGLFFNKNSDYKDENEYRFAVYTDNLDEIFVPIEDSIIGIIVGDRFPTIYACVLEQFSEDRGLICKRLKWHNGNPKLRNDLWING